MPANSESDGRDNHGRFTPEYDDEVILEAVETHEPASTSEIADAVGCSRQNADRRLRQLRERGVVASKKTGPALVWWLEEKEHLTTDIDPSDGFWNAEPGSSAESTDAAKTDEYLADALADE